MERIFVNLKRFEVPIERGGVCPSPSPREWINSVIRQCVELGYGDNEVVRLVFFLPEALIVTTKKLLNSFPPEKRSTLEIGCQGVFREDIRPGGNFGAFTTNLPATAAANLGCTWAIIGHSEERNDKMGVLREFAPEIDDNSDLAAKALAAIDRLMNQEVLRALEAGLNVLICVGETAAERGNGDFASKQRCIETVLRRQVLTGLEGVQHLLGETQIVIGYEPIWAIGPGKVPPGKEYVQYVTQTIKAIVRENMSLEVPVVYGGGLKKENAGMLGSIAMLDGGLVALTRFTGQIGFDPQELDEIIQAYLGSRGDS